MKSFAVTDLEVLRRQVSGPVFMRGDAALEQEVAGFNLAVAHSPDIVVGATSAQDVAEAVRFAARYGLGVSMQATGHGATVSIERGMLITTSRLSTLTVDRGSRIASIGAGLRWGPVIAAAAAFGLTPIVGSSADVGAVGYTMGGGLGPLARTYGFSADYARGFEVVTADGEIRQANRTEHPDLFWALCGGKGGLGVVTSMQFELVPLMRLYAGALYFAADHVATALRAWTDWVRTAPETATSSVALVRFPQADAVPPLLRGRTVLHLRYAFVGETPHGERLLAPLRRAAPVLMDTVAEIAPTAIASVHSDPAGPLPAWTRGMLLAAIDQDFVTTLLAVVGPDADVPLAVVEIRHIAGATARAPEGGNAVGGRLSPFTFNLIGAPVPTLFESVLPRIGDDVTRALGAWIAPATNINFAIPILSAAHYASAWPRAVLDRLERLKAQYDPAGLFTFARA